MFQFSLCSLIVVVLLAGPMIGLLGPTVYHYAEIQLARKPKDENQAALGWLAQHQNTVGTWEVVTFTSDSSKSPAQATTCLAGPVFFIGREQDTDECRQP